MAYNSDGYIMIDFSMVDFRKTNQTIDGLFDRCEKVIGTNKFVIVINANNKTPLTSTVCITNGQYVIESVLYTFSISSNDNLHITKKTTPDELIDDDHVTLKTTYSSNKIVSLLNDVSVKSFQYTGDGELSRRLILPDNIKMIISIIPDRIAGTTSYNYCRLTSPIPILTAGEVSVVAVSMLRIDGQSISNVSWQLSYGNGYLDVRTLTQNAEYNLNYSDVIYTVYYI